MPIPADWYLYLSAVLFIVGAVGVLTRRNLFIILFSIELMMNAVNLNLVGFSRFHENLTGQNLVLFTMVVAAAEAMMAQLNILHKNQELACSNNRLTNIFNTMSEGVLMIDSEGIVSEMNPVAMQIVNKPEQEILGHPIEKVFLLLLLQQ